VDDLMSTKSAFRADLERFNRTLEASGAVVTLEDGWRGIDGSRVPAELLSAYRLLIQYGYANGLLP
jgi:hypothetical protein